MDEIMTKETATELDIKIKAYANAAWTNILESCKALKKMRDTKAYEQLEFTTFGEYTEASLGIKERQAYTYISVLENQGERFLSQNANIGITKLALLNAVPVTEREEIVENNDLCGMTVAEVEALVKENDGRGEQIDLLRGELSELKDKNTELESELEKEKSRPTEVAVKEPSAAELKEIRDKAEKAARAAADKEFKKEKAKLKEKYESEKESAVKAATEKAEKEIAELKEKFSLASSNADAALKRQTELEKQLQVSSSEESTKFTFYFEAATEDFTKIFESIGKLKEENPELADKYLGAVRKYIEILADKAGIKISDGEDNA